MSSASVLSAAIRTALVRAAQDVEKLRGHIFVHHLVEHLPQTYADGLLPQPGFIQCSRSVVMLRGGTRFDHVFVAPLARRPPPLVIVLVAQRIRPARVPRTERAGCGKHVLMGTGSKALRFRPMMAPRGRCRRTAATQLS